MKQSCIPLFCGLLAALNAVAAPTMAVSDFGNPFETTVSTIIPNVLTENLINSGLFEFYERDRLSAVLREQNLQVSGMVNPETALVLGQLTGIKYLLTGEIVDFGREVRSFSGYGVRTDTVFYRLEAAVRVIDTETGRIVFTRTEQAEERQNQGSTTRIIDTTIDARLGRQLANQLTQAIVSAPVFRKAAVESAKPALASIEITSEPANASVEIDGVFYGNAGSAFQIPSGLHQIRVSLPGYEVWDKKVMVRDGASFHVPLERKADIRVEVQEEQTIRTGPAD
jgi:curli biogenesis system outer membrane secretion channel CsgG